MKKKIAVIGAGIMGLTCGYELLKKGYDVTIFEKENRVGGMAASFDFDGLKIERYYHFVCKPDISLFDLLKELGIYDSLKWKNTKMGFFYEGKLYKWGNPLYLLLFPKLGIISKMRYGLHIFLATKKKNWDKLDKKNAIQWLKHNVGDKTYDIFWKILFDLKFYQYKNNLSAAWIWTRIKRMGLSRKNVFTERLGYIEGGSNTLFNKIIEKIGKIGGRVCLNSRVQKVLIEEKKVKGVLVNNNEQIFDMVISTIPLPYINKIIPGLHKDLLDQYDRIKNISVVCPILKLNQKITKNFWLNINDKRIDFPGIIEYSNLNPLKEHIVYLPYYLPNDHPKYLWTDEEFIKDACECLKILNPDFSENRIRNKVVHRYEYAQPICPPGFLSMLPPIKTVIDGLYIADTSYYYPEDRTISASIKLGKKIAKLISGASNGFKKNV